MKIIINENETYNIEFPESITLQELGSMVDRLSMIRKLSKDPILDYDFSSVIRRRSGKGIFSIIVNREQAIDFISKYQKKDISALNEIYNKIGKEYSGKTICNDIWLIRKRFVIKKEDN